jgi:hypothetical protein
VPAERTGNAATLASGRIRGTLRPTSHRAPTSSRPSISATAVSRGAQGPPQAGLRVRALDGAPLGGVPEAADGNRSERWVGPQTVEVLRLRMAQDEVDHPKPPGRGGKKGTRRSACGGCRRRHCARTRPSSSGMGTESVSICCPSRPTRTALGGGRCESKPRVRTTAWEFVGPSAIRMVRSSSHTGCGRTR